MARPFKITLLLSASIHIVCFGIFEPTLGNPLAKPNLTRVAFLGAILEGFDFSSSAHYPKPADIAVNKYAPFFKGQALNKIPQSRRLGLTALPAKPPAVIKFDKQNKPFIPEVDLGVLKPAKKEPTLIFYPPLPYSFLLYFQDRQVAHIEFMFYISQHGKVASVKRKVSSGNLDADLLALRYIIHCLNVYGGNFPADSWQSVAIELSRENDKD